MSVLRKNVNADSIIEDLSCALLSWYDFAREGAVLYIEGREDYLSERLKAQGHPVQFASADASASEEFARRWEGGFAYVIASGCLEEAADPWGAFKAWRRLLMPEGCMLLGVRNRLGLCYFCGERDPYSGRNFDGIENYRRIGQRDWAEMKGRLYARDQIEGMLEESGFARRKFYSVLPALWAPQMLFAEDYLPQEDMGIRLFPMYADPDTVFLEEEFLYGGLAANGLFHAMANAYLIECPLSGAFCDARQVTLSTDRGPEAAQATILKEKSVEKLPLYPEGERRMEALLENSRRLAERGLPVVPLKRKGAGCSMPFVEGPSGQRYLHDLAFADKEAFIQKMDAFRDMILASSQLAERPVKASELLGGKKELGEDGSDQDDLGTQLCLREGYMDLVPLNTIYHEGKFWILDQEFMEECLPAAVILTRMVDIVYVADERLESIVPKDFFWKRYGLDEHLAIWRRKADAFTTRLRNERELRQYHEAHRRNYRVIHANRQKINFSTKEYLRLFVNIFDGLEDGAKKLYLFGSGRYADQFLAYYRRKQPVEALLDNNREKWGKELDGVPILPPQELLEKDPETYKVIICIKDYVGVMKQLTSMGVKDYAVYDAGMEYPAIVRAEDRRKPGAESRGDVTASGPAASQTDALFPEPAPGRAPGPALKPYRTGYVAGVFDLFHMGHLNLLRRAKEQCDYLIVGVVTDEGVRKNKKTNPFVPFSERLEIVRACRYVDEAVEIPLHFASTRDAYRMYHFDVQFSGSDYAEDPDWLAEKQFLEKQGAEMVFFPYTQSTSSTKLKQLIERKLE